MTNPIPEQSQTEIEAAAFRKLVNHLVVHQDFLDLLAVNKLESLFHHKLVIWQFVFTPHTREVKRADLIVVTFFLDLEKFGSFLPDREVVALGTSLERIFKSV